MFVSNNLQQNKQQESSPNLCLFQIFLRLLLIIKFSSLKPLIFYDVLMLKHPGPTTQLLLAQEQLR